mmetsp:Transcript_19505/g.31661  ORF Transcript_19505/g.31661 Transcript_19505/m.31661 type:complete len:87 (+) Transcript_19505:87-347(+)
MFDQMKQVAAGAVGGAQKTVLEQTIKTVEEQSGNMAPGYVKCFFPCCGGPVETLKKFEFAIPEDKKDEFQKGYTSYTEAKEKLKNL